MLASNSPHAPGISEEERVRRGAHGQRMLCYLLTIAVGFGIFVVLALQVRCVLSSLCKLRGQADCLRMLSPRPAARHGHCCDIRTDTGGAKC